MRSYIFKYLRKIKKSLIIFSILNALSALIGAIIPLISGVFIDSLISSHNYSVIFKFVLFLVMCLILQLLLAYIVQIQTALLQTKLVYDIQNNTLLKIQQTQLYYVSNFNIADLTQRISSDATSISTFVISTGSSLLVYLFSFLFSFALLFSVKWEIALFILLFMFIYIIYFFKLQRKLSDKQRILKTDYSHYFSHIYSQLSNLKNLKIFYLQNYYDTKLFEAYKKYKESLQQFKIYSFRLSSGDILLTLFAQIIIFIFGGISVMHGDMTIGIFSVLISYFNMMLNSIKFIPSITTQYAEMSASYYRLNELTTLTKDSSGNEIPLYGHTIEMKNVSVKYPNSRNRVLSNINYSFTPGKLYCLKGTNGSGKTTLLDIISKLNFSYEGSIFLDNINISSLNTNIYRSDFISYMTQESFVFNDNLSKNLLSYSKSNQLKTLLNDLNLDKYLIIEDDISHLISGGEKQKISFIRSISKPFKVLLLDEPTNHLDITSKKIILEYLNTLKKDKIIIISSHDTFILDQIDQIIDLNFDFREEY